MQQLQVHPKKKLKCNLHLILKSATWKHKEKSSDFNKEVTALYDN